LCEYGLSNNLISKTQIQPVVEPKASFVEDFEKDAPVEAESSAGEKVISEEESVIPTEDAASSSNTSISGSSPEGEVPKKRKRIGYRRSLEEDSSSKQRTMADSVSAPTRSLRREPGGYRGDGLAFDPLAEEGEESNHDNSNTDGSGSGSLEGSGSGSYDQVPPKGRKRRGGLGSSLSLGGGFDDDMGPGNSSGRPEDLTFFEDLALMHKHLRRFGLLLIM